MTPSIITIAGLALAFIPVGFVVLILYRWSMDMRSAVYAIARMLIQLVLIGYVLGFIFVAEQAWIIAGILTIMLLTASWIAIRPLHDQNSGIYVRTLFSIVVGSVPVLILVTQGVIDIHPWYQPRILIPLGGMIFASSMNTVSLAAERFAAEANNQLPYGDARRIAFQAALIPLINSLLAVGIVSLPGMMTGQILAGVSPLIAARYQIVVMCMLFGSSGISAACYLLAARKDYQRMT